MAQPSWHVDLDAPTQGPVPGVQSFVLIDDLEPAGGATLTLAGSHRLQRTGVHGALREHPRLRDVLTSPAAVGEGFDVDGVRLEVVELWGRAGTIYLMDLRVLHSPSVNRSKRMRMMATQRFVRAQR